MKNLFRILTMQLDSVHVLNRTHNSEQDAFLIPYALGTASRD